MRILTISNAAWDDRNSVGNTQSNWFSDWPGVEICSLYTRGAVPYNKCCHYYFQVTISDILKHLFSREKIGRLFTNNDIQKNLIHTSSEEKIAISATGWKRSFFQKIVEIVYSSKIWFNNRIKEFIVDFNPDIVFCFAIAEPFRYSILKFVSKNTSAKIVTWIADDVYGQTYSMDFFTRWVYQRRYRTLFDISYKVYGVSQMLCEEYSRLYGIIIDPLYKGCSFMPCKSSVNNPIRIIYAGNLYYGRDRTLSALAAIIRQVNKDKCNIELSIYSATSVSKEVLDQLSIDGSSKLYGPRPYSEIKDLMSESDIVLHVESFDAEQIKDVRLSFSTKIIDCMQSGSTIMAIGPKGIASIEYLRSIKGVIVIDDLKEIEKNVKSIIERPERLLEKAKDIQKFARINHSSSRVRSQLSKDLGLIG